MDGEEVSGHALMASCPPASHIQNNPNVKYPHKMPDIPLLDLQKLFELSTRITLPDAELTPIQAWAYITRDERFRILSEVDFEDIKQELLRKVRCYGYVVVIVLFHFDANVTLASVPSSKTLKFVMLLRLLSHARWSIKRDEKIVGSNQVFMFRRNILKMCMGFTSFRRQVIQDYRSCHRAVVLELS
jgi:hypothetical protein